MQTERVLITGGAGFIGSNLVHRLLTQGHEVVIFDNLSRPGCKSNLAWLRDIHGSSSFRLICASLTDYNVLQNAVRHTDRIYHLAGQVAVTSSVRNPRQDFEDNAIGTFNVLEAARSAENNPIIIYASTNKVYGGMENIEIIEEETRYRYADLPCGIPEEQPLDFHSPYGCSKGTGDQYMRDYARIYGLRTVVVRQSCIYGYRQLGIEDQGWLAWFMIAALKGRAISIFGDGKQVRDLLFIDDLLNAYDAIVENISTSAGQIYNIGGGPRNTLSIWAEFGTQLEFLFNAPIPVCYKEWRQGDQPIYVSDIQKAKRDLGWYPLISVQQGTELLFNWIKSNQHLFEYL